MTNINDVFPSKYLKASDLKGREVTVAMRELVMEKIGDDTKPILYFMNKEKGMVLNKTNSMNIAIAYGPETEAWAGHSITLFASWVDYQGKQVQGLRVRAVQSQQPAPAQSYQAPPNYQAPPVVQHPNAPGASDPFDDEIPF